MCPLIQEARTQHTPESLVLRLGCLPGVLLLRSGGFDPIQGRYSFVCANPFLTFRSFGSRCELLAAQQPEVQFGNPWIVLDNLLARYELLEELDLPFPLGGCFGYWGYDLKNFIEPKLGHCAVNELELPDCWLGFYSSLVAFDHCLGKTWVLSTGLQADGSRCCKRQTNELHFWSAVLENNYRPELAHDREWSGSWSKGFSKTPSISTSFRGEFPTTFSTRIQNPGRSARVVMAAPWQGCTLSHLAPVVSNLSRGEFMDIVSQAQRYIHAGDIYQVNLSQRLSIPFPFSGWEMFQTLASVSPAPFSAYLDCGDFQLASSSPELFMRVSGRHVVTRPIKGTRPRSGDRLCDAQLAYELQTSTKEMAELVMITDLLRNDLGKVCEFGSVQVPELMRLERYAQVQHLVSTVEGRLRDEITHLGALAACFPGGSITGAPKFRAMQIIDELEPSARGPYTGVLGYVGFNRESQLSIIIRTAVCSGGVASFHVGAGIVADSLPAAEYEETLHKARGFFEALGRLKSLSNGALQDH